MVADFAITPLNRRLYLLQTQPLPRSRHDPTEPLQASLFRLRPWVLPSLKRGNTCDTRGFAIRLVEPSAIADLYLPVNYYAPLDNDHRDISVFYDHGCRFDVVVYAGVGQ